MSTSKARPGSRSSASPPAANTRALGFHNDTEGAGKLRLPLVNGELNPAILESLLFGTSNTFGFVSAARKPVLKLNKATGLVTGSVIDDGGLKRSLTGTLFLDGMTAKLHGTPAARRSTSSSRWYPDLAPTHSGPASLLRCRPFWRTEGPAPQAAEPEMHQSQSGILHSDAARAGVFFVVRPTRHVHLHRPRLRHDL